MKINTPRKLSVTKVNDKPPPGLGRPDGLPNPSVNKILDSHSPHSPKSRWAVLRFLHVFLICCHKWLPNTKHVYSKSRWAPGQLNASTEVPDELPTSHISCSSISCISCNSVFHATSVFIVIEFVQSFCTWNKHVSY